MIRILQLIFMGHAHKWKTIKEGPIYRPEGTYGGMKYGRREGQRYVQQCETCGLIVKRDLL